MVSLQEKPSQKIWTDEEFASLPEQCGKYEIVDGELREMGNSGMKHGNIAAFLGGVIEIYARQHKLGITCDSSTAFTLQNGNRRSPDISFIAKQRLQGITEIPQGFFTGAPDLAVEVISPSNTFNEIHQKILEYFENGSKLVWVIYPEEQFVLVYHELTPDKFLRTTDNLDGEDVIPGFTVPVADLFRKLEFS